MTASRSGNASIERGEGGVEHWLYHFSGTAGVLAVYTSDVCQFRDSRHPLGWEQKTTRREMERGIYHVLCGSPP